MDRNGGRGCKCNLSRSLRPACDSEGGADSNLVTRAQLQAAALARFWAARTTEEGGAGDGAFTAMGGGCEIPLFEPPFGHIMRCLSRLLGCNSTQSTAQSTRAHAHQEENTHTHTSGTTPKVKQQDEDTNSKTSHSLLSLLLSLLTSTWSHSDAAHDRHLHVGIQHIV